MDQCGKSVVSQNHETGIRMREREGSFWLAKMKASCLLPEVGYVRRWFWFLVQSNRRVIYNIGMGNVVQAERRYVTGP